jgi:hypothetical protein
MWQVFLNNWRMPQPHRDCPGLESEPPRWQADNWPPFSHDTTQSRSVIITSPWRKEGVLSSAERRDLLYCSHGFLSKGHTGGCLCGGKAAETWSSSLTPIYCSGFRMNGSIPPVFPYDFMVCTWYSPFHVRYLQLWENTPIRTSSIAIYWACKVNVKSLCTSWTITSSIHLFLTSAPGWDKLSPSRPSALPPGKETPVPIEKDVGWLPVPYCGNYMNYPILN